MGGGAGREGADVICPSSFLTTSVQIVGWLESKIKMKVVDFVKTVGVTRDKSSQVIFALQPSDEAAILFFKS